jgi:hypothetical protein
LTTIKSFVFYPYDGPFGNWAEVRLLFDENRRRKAMPKGKNGARRNFLFFLLKVMFSPVPYPCNSKLQVAH